MSDAEYPHDDGLAAERTEWWEHLRTFLDSEHAGAIVIRVTHAHVSRSRDRHGNEVLRRWGTFLVTCRRCRTTRTVEAESVLKNRATRCRSERCRAFEESNPVEVGGHVVGWAPHTD